MDTFTLIVTVGMALLVLWVVALGLFHPRSGADVLHFKPTRSPELEVQNDLDDVEQMIAAQNALRARHGKARRTQAEVEDQVRRHQRELTDYLDAYWADQRAMGSGGDAAPLVVYEVPTCSKCARLQRLLAEREIEHERIDLRTAQLDAARIGALLAKAGVTPRDALRPNEPGGVALIERDASDEEVLAAIAADLSLLMRPIAERGDRAVVARPAERALDLL